MQLEAASRPFADLKMRKVCSLDETLLVTGHWLQPSEEQNKCMECRRKSMYKRGEKHTHTHIHLAEYKFNKLTKKCCQKQFNKLLIATQ